MRDSVNFYSNCLIEALKAKIKHPIKTKIRMVVIPDSLIPHFIWVNNNTIKEFGNVDVGDIKWYKSFLYKGYIQKHNISFYQKICGKLKWKIVGNI